MFIRKFKKCVAGLLCLLLFLTIPAPYAHADPSTGGNADGSSGGSGSQTVVGGPYYTHTGWLFSEFSKIFEKYIDKFEKLLYYDGGDNN